jgi:glycosyltransferase involved in cell wall biosynthesis
MWVDTELFSPDKYDNSIKEKYNIQWKLLLFVGRLAEKKGVKYLVDAMPGIIKQYPDTKLLIVWHGPLELELKNQAKELNLSDSIIFAWAIPNGELPRYYATADIFVWPSIEARDGDSEWFWLVFVEAILSWCITIGSSLHGITDIIENGRTGFLIRQKNSQDITNLILKVLDTDTFDKDIARNIVQEKYSWQVIGKKYINLLMN